MLPASGVLKARPRFWPTRSLGDGAMVELLRCQRWPRCRAVALEDASSILNRQSVKICPLMHSVCSNVGVIILHRIIMQFRRINLHVFEEKKRGY